ncbi:MAG TPA: hypothetical protein VKR58_10510 [Aquella sp.]|nr:hypothetical protein [Aquella sp.]
MLGLKFIFFVGLLCYFSVQDSVATGIVLGQGYVSTTGVTLAGSCLLWGQGDAWKDHVVMSNPQSTLNFKEVDSSEELQDLLGGSLGVSANVGGWGAEVSGGASSEFNTSSSSIHMIYAMRFEQDARLNLEQSKYNTVSARKALLTAPVFELYGRAFNADTIFVKCGDMFISGAQASGLLLVDVEIKFSSTQAKNDFDAKLKVSGNVAGVTMGISAGLSMAEKNAKGGTMVTLKAMQYGGDRMKLAEIFGSQDSSGVYAIQNCGSNSTGGGKCSDILGKIIDYAEFLQLQFTDNKGNIDSGKLFYSRPEYTSYTDIFGSAGSRTDNSQSESILEEIENNYENLTQNITIINEYLSLTSKIHSIHKSKATAYTDLQKYNDNVLKKIKSRYDSNKDLKSCAITLNSKECTEAKKAIATDTKELSSGHDYDTSLLEYIKQNNFSIYYLLSLADGADPANPRFKYISCGLRPLTPQAEGLYVLDGCGLRDKYNYVTITRDSLDNLEMSEFIYDVKNGDSIYRFKYPKIKLTRLGKLESYGSGKEEISVKYVKCTSTCPVDWEKDLTEISKNDIAGLLKFKTMYVITDSLATVYPNVWY